MRQRTIRAALVSTGVLAVSIGGAGAASASPEAPQGDCKAYSYINESAVAVCYTSQPGTIQVILECTNTSGPPYPVTIFGPVVRAEAGNQSIAQCPDGNKRTGYFFRLQP